MLLTCKTVSRITYQYTELVETLNPAQFNDDDDDHVMCRMKLAELVDTIFTDVTQHCFRITDEQHQQLRAWHWSVLLTYLFTYLQPALNQFHLKVCK